MLSPTDTSVVLVGTIVATGLTLSLPLVFMAVLPGCITPDPRCFDYAREVASAVSKREDVDPCDDFYSYVCGNFEDMYPGHSSYLALLESRLYTYQNHVLDGHPVEKNDEVGRHVIIAFRRCVDEYRQNQDSPNALRFLLRSAGIQWSPKVLAYTRQDILGVLLRLSLEFGVPVLLHAILGPSLKHTADSRQAMNLDFRFPLLPAGAGERTLSVVEDTLRLVAHNGTVFDRFRHEAMQVLLTLKRLWSWLNASLHWRGGLQYVKFSQAHEHLVKFTEPGQLLKLTNDALPTNRKRDYFGPDDDVVTSTPTLVTTFADFVAVTKPIDLVLLVRYLAVESLLPVSSSHLVDVYSIDRKAAFRLRVHACLRDAIDIMPRAWEHLFYQERLGQRYPALDATMTSILDSAMDQYSWMDDETWQRAERRIRQLRVVLGPPPALSKHEAVQRRYKHAKPLPDSMSFAAWILENRAAELVARAGELAEESGTPSKGTFDPDATSGMTERFRRTLDDMLPIYIASDHTQQDLVLPYFMDTVPSAVLDTMRRQLLVSPAMLFPPFVVPDDLPYSAIVNYAALGSITASMVARHLDPVTGVYDHLGIRKEAWYTPQSNETYFNLLRCIQLRQASYEGVDVTNEEASEPPPEALAASKYNQPHFQPKVLAHTVGLRMAHSAYRKRAEKNAASYSGDSSGEQIPFFKSRPSLGIDEYSGAVYDAERLFFAAYCLQLCGVVLPRGVTGSLPLNVRCNLPLREVSQFGRAFNCPNNSAMVSRDACL
ncbi:endothelin-converting enzyme-like 1 [Dermacentor variabilis]|uniref:endothelin-converting enzyme-like 1 n=1 Tax=Dermacentor variabilis TaxID=34621 RepID=UPI003F5AF85A